MNARVRNNSARSGARRDGLVAFLDRFGIPLEPAKACGPIPTNRRVVGPYGQTAFQMQGGFAERTKGVAGARCTIVPPV